MDVTESSQGSPKDDKEGEVSSTCSDSRNNEERASIEVASNSNNPISLECGEPSSVLEGTSTQRSLSPDTSNALGGLMEGRGNFPHNNPTEAEQSGESVLEHRGHIATGGNSNVPSVSCDASTPESNQVSDRGNSEEMLTSTTEDSVMIAQALEDENIAISESGEELENRPSSAGQNNPQEDFISVSSASNVRNSDEAGNSNIPGMLGVEEEVDTAVDGNVPFLPGAADSTTLELMELSDDSSSSVGENFGVSTTAREVWQVSTTQSYHSNSEIPTSECVPSAYSHSGSASTSRVVESGQSVQRECQQSDTVSATENGEGANVSTTIRETSRPAVARERIAHPPSRDSNTQSSDRPRAEVNDTVSASIVFPRVENRGNAQQSLEASASSCAEQRVVSNPIVVQSTPRKNVDSVSSSKDYVAKVEEASGSQPSTSRNQESRIDTTTCSSSKSTPGTPHRRSIEGQAADMSSFSITTSNRDRNSQSDSSTLPVSRGSGSDASAILRLIGLEDENGQSNRMQTDSRVSTSGQSASKGGASSTSHSKTPTPRDVSSMDENITTPLQSSPQSTPMSITRPLSMKSSISSGQPVKEEAKDSSKPATGPKETPGGSKFGITSLPSSSSREPQYSKANIPTESKSNAPAPSSANIAGEVKRTASAVHGEVANTPKGNVSQAKVVKDNKTTPDKVITRPSPDEPGTSASSCSHVNDSPHQSSVGQALKDALTAKTVKMASDSEGKAKELCRKIDSSSAGESSFRSDVAAGQKKLKHTQIESEVSINEESEVEWSEEAVLIGEEVSMSAVEEALFSAKSEVDRFQSGESMEDSDSTSQPDIKDESGPLKRFGSSINIKPKKSCIEKGDPSGFPYHSSMRGLPPKPDMPSTSKKASKPMPRDNLEEILSAMEGSSMEADMSSASCTPPMADQQNSNESGGDAMNMESIMADLLKSKMEAMDADSGSDDVQIIEVIEHPRKEQSSETVKKEEGMSMGERILVEIGEGGGIRVGPMQPSRGSIRSTRGLPGITVMRGSMRGRGRGSRSVMGDGGRGNQLAMRRGVGRGGGRGSGRGRGGGGVVVVGGDGSPGLTRGVGVPRGMGVMGSTRGVSGGMPPSPRGMCISSPRGMGAMGSPRGGPASAGKVGLERGGRGVPLGRPPGRGLGSTRGGRGGEQGRGTVLTRGRGNGVRGIGIGGGRGAAVLGRGMGPNIGRDISITVGRGMVMERIPPVTDGCRGMDKGMDLSMERPGVVISASRGMGYGSGRGVGRGGAEVGLRGSGSGLVRGVSSGRGSGSVRGSMRGSRGMGRGGAGRPSGRPLGRPRGSGGGGRGSTVAGISLSPDITLVPQDMKMPHVQLDVSVGSQMAHVRGINTVKREGLTIIPHGPAVPAVIKEEDPSSHDVIVVAEVGGAGSVKVEQGCLDRLGVMQDEKLNVPVTVEVKMEDVTMAGEVEDPLLSKRKRKPRKPMELSSEVTRAKRPRKAKVKSEDEPKSKKGKKGGQKKATPKKAAEFANRVENAIKNGFTEPVPIDGSTKSTVQIFEEETRMSAESGSRSQTPARTVPPTGVNPEEEASQGSMLSNGTTESAKKKVRLEVYDPDSNVEFTADNLAEYQWPLNDKTAEHYMIQEQVSEYLGVKSFKRKYPDLKRRVVEAEEKAHLREKGMVSESLCDLGLTALNSSEVLDVMFADFQDKYEEYRRVTRERQAKEISIRQKAVVGEKNKQSDYKRRAMKSAASWNASFNKERKEERGCCFDLQSFTIHYPQSRGRLMTREKPRIGHYPISLIPGQYTDFYKRYTPTELRYYPLNTVLYGPMRPNEMEEHASDGSQSESEDSSSSDDSSSSSSEATQDTEETCSTADLETENASSATAEGSGGNKSNATPSTVGPICKSCGGDRNRNKLGRPEPLIQCAQCESNGHPSCLDLTLDMVPHIKSYDWQCTDCKTCIECKDPADEDKMLFCDMCDRGYHIYCVGLRKVPSGSWHCQVCEPASKDQLAPNLENGNGSGIMPWQNPECKNGEREKTVPQMSNPHFPKALLSKI